MALKSDAALSSGGSSHGGSAAPSVLDDHGKAVRVGDKVCIGNGTSRVFLRGQRGVVVRLLRGGNDAGEEAEAAVIVYGMGTRQYFLRSGRFRICGWVSSAQAARVAVVGYGVPSGPGG